MNVFVMIPFQDEFTDTYQKAIAPAVRATGMEPIILAPVIGTNQVPGPIDAQIIDAIKTSHFGIADLTGHNPNVMYEIAYAHSLEKLVIIITQDSPNDTPFDVRHHRIIHYSPTECEALRNDLQKSIDSILTADGSEVKLLRRALVPLSIDTDGVNFVVAANPLSYRAAYRHGGGWKDTPRTGGDYVGIRGLIQSFGLIGLGKLPELVNPDDFDDVVYENHMNG
jgi:hypothetical protein